jgi:hypothetical protein
MLKRIWKTLVNLIEGNYSKLESKEILLEKLYRDYSVMNVRTKAARELKKEIKALEDEMEELFVMLYE